MTVAIFVEAVRAEPVGDRLADEIAALIRPLPGLAEALLYRPLLDAVDHPFAADGSGPALALELAFATVEDAAPVLAPEHLGRLAALLPGAELGHGAFSRRDFPVADPTFRVAEGEEPCTFLVRYPGPADDPTPWLDHYDAHHPPIMCRFPGIRRVATYRPLAVPTRLGWAQDRALQRNKVAFDSPAALAAALASPVMAEMRADRNVFPPFTGGATHVPMRTRIVA